MSDLLQAHKTARDLALDAITERCKTDLYFLCKYILGYDLMTEFTHGDLCDFTQSLLPNDDQRIPSNQHKELMKGSEKYIEDLPEYDPSKKFLFLNMPRNTFKSSVVTIGFALQFILNNPDGRVLIDSETYSKAKNFLAEVKGHLEDSDKFREVYNHIYGMMPDDGKRSTSVRWKDNEIDLSCRTKKRKEASFTASGIDKSINGMHYDLIICDDLHSEVNTKNKEQIEQVIEHWKLCLSLLEPNKYMIVIGTRWSYSDLYQYLIDFEKERFNFFVRQAIFPGGELLFPEIIDQKFLDNQKKSQGSYIFSCQYMNNPIDDETAVFKRSYFQVKKWEDITSRPMNWFLAIDPSYEGPYSDWVGIVECGIDYMGELYVGDIYRLKQTYSETVNFLFDLYHRSHRAGRPYKAIGLETVATQKGIGYILNNEMRQRGEWLPVREISSRTKTKEERIRALAPYYEFKRVWHIQDAKGHDDLEDELLHFPVGKHDDVIDAFATILEIGSQPKNRETTQNREKRDKLKRLATKPRSPMTGI